MADSPFSIFGNVHLQPRCSGHRHRPPAVDLFVDLIAVSDRFRRTLPIHYKVKR